jgi:hypothetical protein
MSKLKPLLWVAIGIACVHGYMYLATEQVHPCRAAEARLLREYGPGVAFAIGLTAVVTQFTAPQDRERALADSPLGRDPKGRQLLAKMSTVDRFGVIGCYLPGIFGWGSVPPFA